MNSHDHLSAAIRILAGLKKFSLPDDYLAVVDGAMIAGYHLGNALLHKHGVLPDAEHANTPSKLERPIDIQLAGRSQPGSMSYTPKRVITLSARRGAYRALER